MGKKGSILIIDDEADIRDVLKELFEQNNYAVCLADNGVKAVALVEKEKYDLAIIDLCMPVIDGLETTRKIKAACPDIHVFMMSANPYKVSRKEIRKSGAVALFDKPLDFDLILNTISKYLT
jgi:CheY-like chemotaxis protein